MNEIELNKDNDKIKNNYIIGEIDIAWMVGKRRIINSYEEDKRKYHTINFEEEFKNEKEIKECKIEINNKNIPFCYFYEFEKEGNYTIKYSFENYITKTNYMFLECTSLKYLNLSNFNTQNVTSMRSMFWDCRYLIYLNLSNFNTQNVTTMKSMFEGCSSLKDLNLSSFNTQNVTDMNRMFLDCSSLTYLNLSNFNTQNVKTMGLMFAGCSSLTNLNLSNFNTQNVASMYGMFNNCKAFKIKTINTKDSKILELMKCN